MPITRRRPLAQRAHKSTPSEERLFEERLNVNGLEGWLWNAACSIRGPIDAPKFKDYILPLIFVKRLSDVFDDEVDHLAEKFDGDRELALALVDEDHSLVRFYIPPEASWAEIRKLAGDIGQRVTDVVRAVSDANPSLKGVIDIVDFNATVSGQRIIEDGRLSILIEILSRHRLGLDDVEPDLFGRAYASYVMTMACHFVGQG
jgi:type I restriction enzyme M protein